MPTYNVASRQTQSLLAWASATTWDLGSVPNSPAADVEIGYLVPTIDIAAGQAYTVGTVDTASNLTVEGILAADNSVTVEQRFGSISLNGGTISTPSLPNVGTIYSYTGTITGSVADYGQILVYGSLLIDGNVTQHGIIKVAGTSAAGNPALELAGSDSASVNLTTGSLLQLDNPASITGTISIAAASATSATQNTPPIPSSSTIVLEGIAPTSITSLSYAATSANNGVLTIREGTATQTLSFSGSLATSSFAVSDASTATSPASALTITPVPTAPTVQAAGIGAADMGIITNSTSLVVQGTAPLGTTVSVTANNIAAATVTYATTVGSALESYSATIASVLALGIQQVSLTATATNAAGSAQASASESIDVLPSPVNNVTALNTSSFDLAQVLGKGYSFSFQGGTQAVQLTNGTLSVGTDTNQAVVQRLYEGLLHRPADTAGLVGFSNQLAGGTSVVSIANAILASPEYAALNGTPDNTAFVDGLYEQFLGRVPSQPELSGWLNQLGVGLSRGLVASDFATSNEAKAYLASATANLWSPDPNGSLVVQSYVTGLGREPSQAETQGWVQQLLAGLSPQQFAQDIAASAEFGTDHNGQSPQGFVTSLYQSGLGRTPGGSELTGWINQIAGGAPPAAILLGIGSSVEASGRLSPSI